MADLYRIGVSIAMTNGVSQVLGVISKDMLGLEKNLANASAGFGRLKLAAAGAAGVIAGGAVLEGMAKLVEHGKEFVHQQSLMAQAGISQVDIARMTAAAWKTTGDVIGTSAAKNMALMSDLRDALGDVGEAIKAMPAISRLGVYLGNGTGQDQEKAGLQAARFIEQRGGLIDPTTHKVSEARLESQAKMIEAIAAGTHFRVGPQQLMAFQQIARASGALLSDEGLMEMAPVIAASRSPSSVGNQLASLQQQLLGGITTKAGATYLEKLGVLDPSKVHEGRGGHLTFEKDALVNSALAGSNPVEYINRYIRGGLERMGNTTSDQQTLSLMQSHLRATVIGLISEVVRGYTGFHKDAAFIRQASTVDQYDVMQAGDPNAAMNNFTTAWQNLMTALGVPAVGSVAGVLNGLAGVLTRLTTVAAAHPDFVLNLERFAVGFGLLLATGGAMAIAGAALQPFVTGIRGLCTVFITNGIGTTAAMQSFTAAVSGMAGTAGTLLAVAAGLSAVIAAATGGQMLLNKAADATFGGHDIKPAVMAWDRQDHAKDGFWTNLLFNPHPTEWFDGKHGTGGGKMLLHGDVHLDGEKVGRVVAGQMDRGSRPGVSTGLTGSDRSMTAVPTGAAPAY